GVQEACVIASKDVQRGETVKAIIVAKADWQDRICAEDIISWSKEHLSAYKYPRQIEFRSSLPRSATGKVEWRRLQDEESASDAPTIANNRADPESRLIQHQNTRRS